MNVNHLSHRRSPGLTILVVLMAALALLASACGSSGEATSTEAAADSTATTTSAEDDASLVEDATAADAAVDAEPAETDDAATDDDAAIDDAPADDAATESAATESAATETASTATEAADDESAGAAEAETAPPTDEGALLLARSAVAASQGQTGYRIDQGMGLRVSLLDGFIDMDISPEGAIATGEVAGDSSHMTMDLGAFMTETLSATPLGGPTEAELAEMEAVFGDAQIETWQVGSTMYMDMTRFAKAIETMDGAPDPDFAVLAAGPVRIDLDELNLTGAEAASGLGQGMAIVDPAALLDSLLSLDAIAETGTTIVRDVETTMYTGTTSMSAYASATGVDVIDQLGALGELGFSEPDGIAALFDSISVDVTAMVDADDLVRRIEIVLDMAPMLMAMFQDPELLGETVGAAPSGAELAQLQELLGDDMVFITETWQEFYDYGETFVIEPPADATDITDQYDILSAQGLLDA